MTHAEPALVSDRWPRLAAELADALREADEDALAEQVADLRILQQCDCRDASCQSFYRMPHGTTDYVEGGWQLSRLIVNEALDETGRGRAHVRVPKQIVEFVGSRPVTAAGDLHLYAASGACLFFGGRHQPLAQASAAVPLIDDQREQTPELSGCLKHRQDMQCRDADQITIVIGADEPARRGVQPVVEPFLHCGLRRRIP
jgi:hypothetical protein